MLHLRQTLFLRPNTSRLLPLLSMLVVLGPVTVDLYLPALPALRQDLVTSAATTQLTLTATTIGFAVGQLIIGPWSDRVGRRRPLLLATAVHVLGSLGVALAPDIAVVVGFRLVQGIGAAGSSVCAAAMLRDRFDGIAYIRASARLGLVTSATPIVAPFLGALLIVSTSWRGLFAVVASFGAIVFALALLRLPESHHPHGGGRSMPLARRYRPLVSDRHFVGAALIGGLVASAVFAHMTASSFLLQLEYGLTPTEYSMAFAANAVAFVLGSQSASQVLKRLSPCTILAWTLPSMAIAGVGIAVVAAVHGGLPGVIATSVIFFLVAGSSGPCLQLIAMAPHGERAGTAAALLGATYYLMAGVTAPIAGSLGVDSALPMGIVIAAAMIAAVAVFHRLVRPPLRLMEGIDPASPQRIAALPVWERSPARSTNRSRGTSTCTVPGAGASMRLSHVSHPIESLDAWEATRKTEGVRTTHEGHMITMAQHRSATLLLRSLRSVRSRRIKPSLAEALATRGGNELRAMLEDGTIDIPR